MTWRLPQREDRQVAALWMLCAGLTIVFRPLWSSAASFVPACPWHLWTGWPCPGCGTTRAIVRLLHADPLGALRLNPLAVCAAATFVAGGLAAPAWLWCGGKVPGLESRPRPWAIALVAVSFLANWAWLAATGV